MIVPNSPYSMRIELYTHGLRVSNYDYRGYKALSDFARRLAIFGKVRKAPGVFKYEMIKIFASATGDRKEFRFHINHKHELLQFISNYGFTDKNIEFITLPVPAGKDVEFDWIDPREPRKGQPEIIEYLTTHETNSKLVTLQTGKGKMQPLDASILTPDGWTTMGELVVGQTITARDGTPTTVTAIYPHQQKQMFRVTFADGRSTECGAEHLWQVYYINTSVSPRWRVVDTVEMLRLISMPNPRVYVPLIQPQITKEVDLPVDPYLLGLLLGDATISQANILFTSGDSEIIDSIRERLEVGAELIQIDRYGYRFKGIEQLKARIEGMGLRGCKSDEKFIPDVYLKGSIEQRLAIVRGLLDTDGTVSKDGSVSFCSTSRRMAEQLQYLIRSLGGIATLRPRQTYFTYKDEKKAGKPAYEVDIRHVKPSELFTLPRKKDRTNDDNQYSTQLKLRVSSVQPTEIKDARCITVDHPERLYVTDDYIVTHNTFLGMTATRALGKRTVLLIKPMYFKKWIKDVKESFNFKKDQLVTIQGGDDLRTVIEMAREDVLEAQFLIMSNTTYQNYLADFEENNGADNYLDCRPENLFETLGVGLVIVDEAHQLFHLIFRFFCYSNIANVISLSATIVSGNPQVTKMYQVVWPEHTRAPEIEYDKFINVSNIWISVNSMKGIRTKNAMGQYSQVYLEESIIKNPTLLANYTALIADIVRHRFIEVAEGVQKALVFCGTVDMCTNVTEVLKESFPDKRIVRYVSGDPFEDVLEADLTVSTIQSAGTAVDIPNLRVSLMTVALDSVQSNVQVLGRTRQLKDYPDISPEFLFLTIREIEAHVRYANNKVEQFRGKVKSFKNIESSYRI